MLREFRNDEKAICDGLNKSEGFIVTADETPLLAQITGGFTVQLTAQ